MYKELLDLIIKYEHITIFRHLRPDGDAVFSSNALKEWIVSNFPSKTVKLAGNEVYDKFPVKEEVSDEFIQSSLAIICDVSQAARTDDNRYTIAKDCAIIDHHPIIIEPGYAGLIIDEPIKAATCELLADILYSESFKEYKINETVCKYLYCGLLTDSNSFSTANTTANTLFNGYRLVRDGNLKSSDLNEYVFNYNYKSYDKITKFRNYLQLEEGIGYVILSQEDLDNIGMSFDEAKNRVNEFSPIEEIRIWAVFAYNMKTGLYDGSIRSRRKYVINKLCNSYNGGGHDNACGVKNLDLNRIQELVSDLKKIALN